MNFFDLGLGDSKLEQKALSLGYSSAIASPKIFVSSKSGLHKLSLKQKIFSVSSSSSDLLRRASDFAGENSVLLFDAFSVPHFFKDDGLVRSVSEAAGEGKAVAFEIPYAYFLRNSFVYRARFVSNTRDFLKKCLKLGAPYAITSGARDEFELKSPREVTAIAQLWGLSAEQARRAIGSVPEKMVSALEGE